MNDTVIVSREEVAGGGVLAVITVDRPTASNALDRVTKEALLDHVRALAADDTVRAVLLRATGKNFCVGQDLGEHVEALRADPGTAMSTVGEHYNPLVRAFDSLTVPLIVAIRGACVGAGLGIALLGDIRVAGERSTFATAFTGIGLAADSGLSHTLARSLGPSRAAGLLLLGDRFTSTEALAWGLVHRVVPDDAVEDTALELAQRLASGPTLAFQQVKALIGTPADTLTDALERERASQELLGATADHSGAVEAFLAKTRPLFGGR